MSEELKPCPFCVGENLFIDMKSLVVVECQSCSARVPLTFWNDRPRENAFKAELSKQKLIARDTRAPLQKWEPGSEPPDGWYRVMPVVCVRRQTPILMYLHNRGLYYAIPSGVSMYCEWTGETLYGPIPEPEVSV